MKKIKVLIIDDSMLIRQVLSEILSSDTDIEVVDTAEDPIIAREKIKKYNPDVITLDVEMPKMDGITFLKNLMRLRPMPVIMISTLTEAGADITLQALELGAIDYISKPKTINSETIRAYSNEIISKVKMASQVSVHLLAQCFDNYQKSKAIPTNEKVISKSKLTWPVKSTRFKNKIIAIGASTGGTEAVKRNINEPYE